MQLTLKSSDFSWIRSFAFARLEEGGLLVMTHIRGGVDINMHSFINFSFDYKRIFFRENVMSIGQTIFLVNYINVTI